MNDIAIELKGIDKKFGLVHANKNINMKVRKGTIHGIIGENGAGKSTLMSILYGFYQADAMATSSSTAGPNRDQGPERRHFRGHRHGSPAFHAGRELYRARKHHARRRGKRSCSTPASPRPDASSSSSRRNTSSKSIPMPSLRNCPSASSSVSRS
jgi:ABC-type dipeptide/oligopeptide/nickel transport system ATPase component